MGNLRRMKAAGFKHGEAYDMAETWFKRAASGQIIHQPTYNMDPSERNLAPGGVVVICPNELWGRWEMW